MHNQPLEDDPWLNAEARYQPEQEVQGVVTRVTQLGVFIEVEPGIEGIIYTFELGPGLSALSSYAPGQKVQVYVTSLDTHKKRLELSPQPQLLPGLVAERAMPAALLQRQKTTDQRSQAANWPLPELLAQTNEHSCPTCQRSSQANWKYCIYCGGRLQHHCQNCGTVQPVLPDGRYCYECGNLL